jgi:hypothetical protein
MAPMHRRQNDACERSSSIVAAAFSDGISTHICSRSAKYATSSRDRTWAATTINTQIHTSAPAPTREKSTNEDLGSNITRLLIRGMARATRLYRSLSAMEELRRRQTRRGARLCRSHAGPPLLHKREWLPRASCCLRQSTWLARRRCRRGGTGNTGRGQEAIGKNDEWATM